MLVLPQELVPSISELQEMLLHLLCLTSPPMGHFQMETGFMPALEHLPGQLFLQVAL